MYWRGCVSSRCMLERRDKMYFFVRAANICKAFPFCTYCLQIYKGFKLNLIPLELRDMYRLNIRAIWNLGSWCVLCTSSWSVQLSSVTLFLYYKETQRAHPLQKTTAGVVDKTSLQAQAERAALTGLVHTPSCSLLQAVCCGWACWIPPTPLFSALQWQCHCYFLYCNIWVCKLAIDQYS